MSNLFQSEIVKFVCCCGSLKPICFVYFCKHCLRLRCHYCVSHEVDSHFCGNCSENMPAAEAKLKKNKCNACYDCPSCKQTLSIRAATTQTPSEEDPTKLVARKLHYLVCGFCRWSSRDAGIQDKPSANGPWTESETTDETSLDAIGEYFRLLGLREKAVKDRKYVHKSKFLAAGRHGLAHLLPKRFPSAGLEELGKGLPTPSYLAPTYGAEEFLEVSDEFYSEEHVIPKLTTLSQRLLQVDHQPREGSQLLPLQKHLLVKRSLRCRVCERNISKPDYSPVSIKFKIHMNAYYHVPQIRILAPLSTPFLPGQKIKIPFRISNPMQFQTSVKFLPFAFVPLRKEDNKFNIVGLETVGTESAADSSISPFSMSPATQSIREITVLPILNELFNINCHLEPPEAILILPPKDETSDFDTDTDTLDFHDDVNFVPWRRANKATVMLDVERLPTSKEGEPLTFGFTIEYDYTNYEYQSDSKNEEPQKPRIQAHLLVDLDQGYEKSTLVGRAYGKNEQRNLAVPRRQ